MKIHFIGVKGSGMSALAKFVKDLGHEVDGSDKDIFIFTEKGLKANRIPILKFDEIDYESYDLIIAGHDFINSPMVHEAQKLGKEVIEYHHYLARMSMLFETICVAGSHGKTTTSKMIEEIMNPILKTSYIIGDGEGCYVPASNYLVMESCEYKRHFLAYHGNTHLVLNVDLDHVDYFKDDADYQDAFLTFMNQAKNYVIINGDDPFLTQVTLKQSVITYGLEQHNLFWADNIVDDEKGVAYDLMKRDQKLGHVKLSLNGKHIIYNSLAAIATCSLYPIPVAKMIHALSEFSGVNRRWRETIHNDEIYVDDYAHHFNEIKATIQAARARFPQRKIIAIFRPDRHSRILKFVTEFKDALANADVSYVVNFPKTSINDTNVEFDGHILCDEKKTYFFDETDEAYQALAKEKQVVLLFMSSKDLSKVASKIQENCVDN